MRTLKTILVVFAISAVQSLSGLPFLGASTARASCFSYYANGTASDNWALYSFETSLGKIEDFFVTNHGLGQAELLSKIIEVDLRAHFFRLQSLARVYADADPAFFEPYLKEFKKYEDYVGLLALTTDMKAAATELGEPTLAKYFEGRQDYAKQSLFDLLRDNGWTTQPEKSAQRLRDGLRAYDKWMSVSEHRQFVVHEIAKMSKKLAKDSKEMEFDKKDIEKGLHELRRRLRWIPIEILSLDGFVVAANDSLPTASLKAWFAEMKRDNPKILESKYTRYSEPLVSDPIRIPKTTLAMVGNMISKIGDTKDAAEMYNEFNEAMDETSASDGVRARVLAKLNERIGQPNIDHRAAAVEYQERLNSTHLLTVLAEQLKALNP